MTRTPPTSSRKTLQTGVDKTCKPPGLRHGQDHLDTCCHDHPIAIRTGLKQKQATENPVQLRILSRFYAAHVRAF